MNIEKISRGETVELKLTGWLDTMNAPALEEEVNALDSSVSALVVDCTYLEYVSSAGLRLLVAVYKKMNGNMTLQNVSEDILSIIRMTGLERLLK